MLCHSKKCGFLYDVSNIKPNVIMDCEVFKVMCGYEIIDGRESRSDNVTHDDDNNTGEVAGFVRRRPVYFAINIKMEALSQHCSNRKKADDMISQVMFVCYSLLLSSDTQDSVVRRSTVCQCRDLGPKIYVMVDRMPSFMEGLSLLRMKNAFQKVWNQEVLCEADRMTLDRYFEDSDVDYSKQQVQNDIHDAMSLMICSYLNDSGVVQKYMNDCPSSEEEEEEYSHSSYDDRLDLGCDHDYEHGSDCGSDCDSDCGSDCGSDYDPKVVSETQQPSDEYSSSSFQGCVPQHMRRNISRMRAVVRGKGQLSKIIEKSMFFLPGSIERLE